MKQSRMLLRLEIKRAMKKLPQLFLGAAIIFVVVVIIVLAGAAANKDTAEMSTTRVALVTNNNTLVENVGMEMLTNMETVKNLYEFSIDTEESALERFENGELAGIIIFPENYIDNVGRGDNEPAQVLIRNDGMSYSVTMVAEVANAAGALLGATEAASYSVQDWATDYNIENKWDIVDALSVTDARVILSREDIFNKVTIYGEGDVSFVQSYVCAALVILVLLWGLSCGTMLKTDSMVLTRKLHANQISTEKQMVIKLTALICLLGSVFMVIGAVLLGAYAVAPQVFALVDIDSVWQIVLLLLSFIPIIFLAATIVMFAYTAASNQIGGILLLFISTIVMSYISGCLLPSVYLPETIRNMAKFLPTTYMHETATKALVGVVDGKYILIIVAYALVFFAASVGIMKYKENKV